MIVVCEREVFGTPRHEMRDRWTGRAGTWSTAISQNSNAATFGYGTFSTPTFLSPCPTYNGSFVGLKYRQSDPENMRLVYMSYMTSLFASLDETSSRYVATCLLIAPLPLYWTSSIVPRRPRSTIGETLASQRSRASQFTRAL